MRVIARVVLITMAVMPGLFSAKAQYTNVRVSSPLFSTPEEATLAINPTNPKNLIAGANLRFRYWSTDGGQTWMEARLPQGTYGDPCVIFDASGQAYYAHLSDLRFVGGKWLDRLAIHRSSDGGWTWYDSTVVGLNPPKAQDKEWLASDMTSSPYRNNVYIAWTEFDVYGSTSSLDSTRILFSRSTNAGSTWSNPIRISDVGGNCVDEDSTVEGAVPAVGPNGEVYIAWSGPLGIMFDRSFDGGVTFGRDIFVDPQPGGWDFRIEGIYRANGLPVTACDVSNSPYRGTVYVLWSDQRNGTGNTDVFLAKSTNQGSTWSTKRRVNTDLGSSQQFFPWLTIDQSTGNLYAVFYDRRAYAAGDSTTDVYVARSNNGGESWTDFKISQIPFTSRSSIFFGDYINIAAHEGKIHAIWMRLDTTVLSIWTTMIDEMPTAISPVQHDVTDYSLQQNYPNPFNASTTISFSLTHQSFVTLIIRDMLGRTVAKIVEGELPEGEHVARFYSDETPSGVYVYTLSTGLFRESRKFVVMK